MESTPRDDLVKQIELAKLEVKIAYKAKCERPRCITLKQRYKSALEHLKTLEDAFKTNNTSL